MITDALQRVRQRIAKAAQQAGRDPAAIHLLAVSKTFPVASVLEAYQAGQCAFGENYVQELQHKALALQAYPIEWHFIGPLQSNKTRVVAELAHWVHSVDRLKIAQRLSEQRPAMLPALNVCLQVNVSGESQKSGCTSADLPDLARAVKALPHLALKGLMCIPEATADQQELAAQFALLRQLKSALSEQGITGLDTLSMGMSSDLELAIQNGSTWVRVGSAIFGKRST